MLNHKAIAIAFLAVAALSGAAHAGAFSDVNHSIVVVRLGEGGSSPLPTTNAAVYLDQYDISGATPTLLNTVAVPSAGDSALTMAILNASHDGQLHFSTNKQYLTFGGYRADANGTSDVIASSASSVARVIGRVDLAGNVDTTTALGDAYNATVIRTAATDDGTHFWVCGDNASGTSTTGGSRYAVLGGTTSVNLSKVQVTGGAKQPDNVRDIAIYNSQLYISSGSSSSVGKGVMKEGTGLPTSGSQALTMLTPDAYSISSFAMLDLDPNVAGIDTIYGVGDALKKYYYNGTSWVLKGTVTLPGAENVTAFIGADGNPVVLGANSAGIFKLTDTSGIGGTMTATFGSAYISAPSNTAFRGLTEIPEPISLSFLLGGGLAMVVRRNRNSRS